MSRLARSPNWRLTGPGYPQGQSGHFSPRREVPFSVSGTGAYCKTGSGEARDPLIGEMMEDGPSFFTSTRLPIATAVLATGIFIADDFELCDHPVTPALQLKASWNALISLGAIALITPLVLRNQSCEHALRRSDAYLMAKTGTSKSVRVELKTGS